MTPLTCRILLAAAFAVTSATSMSATSDVANEDPAPRWEAVLVPTDSSIRTLADLKGKKIALNKGSSVYFLLVKVLEKVGVQYSDIRTVFLTPADGRPEFEKGAVDAWAIWDPFQAASEAATEARTTTGEGLVLNQQFDLSSRKFAAANPKAVEAADPPKYCVVTADAPAINIRATPGGNIIGQIPIGAPIRVGYVQQPWVYVLTQKGTGWILGQHVDPVCIPNHYYIAPCGPDCEPQPPLPYDVPINFRGKALVNKRLFLFEAPRRDRKCQSEQTA